MTIGTIALAVTLGSIIGMAAILWDLHTKYMFERHQARFWEKQYEKIFRTAKHYASEASELREKLRPFQRTRGKGGKFIGKGQS